MYLSLIPLSVLLFHIVMCVQMHLHAYVRGYVYIIYIYTLHIYIYMQASV